MTRRPGRVRGLLTVVGVVLSCVLLFATVLGVWARRSFLKTDVFADRAGSLIDDEGVQAALSGYLGDQVNALIDPARLFEEALPDRAEILAVPLAGAVEGFVREKVDEVVASDRFAELWKAATETAHREAIRVLRGETPLLEESEDQVVINLLPVVHTVLERIGEASPEIFGRTVDLPTITVDDVPDEARAALSDALGIELDDDFGTFTIYDDGALTTAQEAVVLADRLMWLLVVLTPLVIVGTIALSPRRRRTVLQLAVGATLAMVLLRRFVFLFEDQLLDLVRVERNLPAVEAVTEAFLDPLLTGALWIGLLALASAALTVLTGPYPWAVTLRQQTVATIRGLRETVGERGRDEETLRWIADHQDPLRLAGVAVAVVLLFWLDLSWLGLLVLAGLLVAYEVVVSRLGERAPEAATGA